MGVSCDISNQDFWHHFEKGERYFHILDCLARAGGSQRDGLKNETINKIWFKRLYAGFHTPKAVTYHDL